ncbi:MAG: hypothetical protein JWR24_2646 [Actinoallomurus sp.]|nr:hypothetical protein [Actinoallomurus sp.]
MKCGSEMAVALAGGYLLGHGHKTRLAGLLAILAAVGGSLPIDERELLRRTPLGAPLDKLTGDLRTQLVESGAAVAKKAASNRIDSLSDKLQERAASMRAPGVTKRGEHGEAEEPAVGAPRDELTDFRTQLVDAGMSAAKKAVSSRIDSLSDKLQERTASMRAPGVPKAGGREEAEEPLEEPARAPRGRREPARPERARGEPPRRERAREEASDDYGEYEDDERADRTERDEYDSDEYDSVEYDSDEYDSDEPEPEPGGDYREERRPGAQPARPGPRRQVPRRDEDRRKTGRAAR